MKIADAHCDALYKIAHKIESKDITTESLKHTFLQVFAIWDNWTSVDSRTSVECQINAFKQVFLDATNIYNKNFMPILSLEGCDVLNDDHDFEYLKYLVSNHLKILSLTWNHKNKFASGVNDSGGVTSFGYELIKKFESFGGIIDVSHLNEKSFYNVLDCITKPIFASHSNCFSLCNHKRNLKDNQLKEIINMDGLIGINFYPYFLSGSSKASVSHIVDHIDYICSISGNTKNVCFGSDFDGIDCYPKGITSPLNIALITDQLLKIGYTQKNINQISCGNLCNFVLKY